MVCGTPEALHDIFKKDVDSPTKNVNKPKTMSIKSQIEVLLRREEVPGFVNLNNLAALIISEKHNGIPYLLKRGNLPLVKANLSNMLGGEEHVYQKIGSVYHADRRLALAIIKLYCPDLHEEVSIWETVYGRGDIPEEISKTAPVLHQHIKEIFENTKFRCVYLNGKWFFNVHDIIQSATKDPNNNARNLNRACELDPSIVKSLDMLYKFTGYVK